MRACVRHSSNRSLLLRYMVKIADGLDVSSSGSVTFTAHADCCYTITTRKGVVKPRVPVSTAKSAAFPLPYSDDFDGKTSGSEAPFFGDQARHPPHSRTRTHVHMHAHTHIISTHTHRERERERERYKHTRARTLSHTLMRTSKHTHTHTHRHEYKRLQIFEVCSHVVLLIAVFSLTHGIV